MGSPFARPLPVLVGGLAVARLTRLLLTDEITRPPREALQEWARGTATRRARPRIEYLTTCPWCVSMYVAAGWAGLTVAAPATAAAVGAVLAWSEVSGLLAEVT